MPYEHVLSTVWRVAQVALFTRLDSVYCAPPISDLPPNICKRSKSDGLYHWAAGTNHRGGFSRGHAIKHPSCCAAQGQAACASAPAGVRVTFQPGAQREQISQSVSETD